MIWKSLFKYPVLTVGLLFLSIFLMDLGRRGKLPWPSEKTIATSCRSVLVMLDKRVPATWNTECDKKNNLKVIITQVPFEKEIESKPELVKKALYRELANHLIFIAKNTLNESLARTYYVTLKLQHRTLHINAMTTGDHLSKLKTITRPEFIAEHLKTTVNVTEFIPQ